MHRLIAVEVKYRSDVRQFLILEGTQVCSRLADQKWPEAYLVLVTDRPDSGRSCFQAVDLQMYRPGTGPTTIDLSQVPAIAVFVRNHEQLLKRMFDAIRSELQKPGVKMRSRAGTGVAERDAILGP